MTRTARIIEGARADALPFDELLRANAPVLLKGAVSSWPLVRAAQQGADAVRRDLVAAYDGRPVIVYTAGAETGGRFSYDEGLTGFNFTAARRDLAEVLDEIAGYDPATPHSYHYMNSIDLAQTFPALRDGNRLSFAHPAFERSTMTTRIWIGTQTLAPAHYDIPHNIACCVLGRRRFTLFPPEQIHNLYPGPLSPTPGGQTVTMADIEQPDLDRFPRLEQALAAAITVDLEPGDALYYPSMWWHQVRARDPFNVMINSWWIDAPGFMGDPTDVLMHALLGLRDRSPAEKSAWREWFDYYVFGDADTARAHLPDHVQGALADMTEATARRLRAAIQQGLNR